MNSNRRAREGPWRIGSFTKNFSWGPVESGLLKLHYSLNIGFKDELKPTPRKLFWERIERAGIIPHIPSNFFVFNGIINGESYVFPDELIFKALSSSHDEDFDKIGLFTLLLSEVGIWKGAKQGQSQPSEWARYFILENASKIKKWDTDLFSADRIEEFLTTDRRFEGGTGTRKLATNLAYFFNLSKIQEIPEDTDLNWIADCIFLALDRYYMIRKPEIFGIEWALNTLSDNSIISLTDPFEITSIEYERVVARLYVESKGVERLDKTAANTVFAVINRDPILYKELPDVVTKWLRSRLFVEIADRNQLETMRNFNAEEFYNRSIERLHNQLPKPSITGDQLLALIRPHDDSD